ncbi:MAG TPA: S1 RNA-binding domain-containing protein, partial [Bacteroidia bacterium]|nr:S1 RNA-binding domain-containing protein [Bacteroidia bacterium]
EQFDGIISGVTEWGIFVELAESRCEGLIRMRDVKNDHYYFDEKNLCYIGRKTKRRFALGDKVLVEVKKADMVKKQLDFMLIV